MVRAITRLLALLTAAALAVGAVLVIIEVVAAGVGAQPLLVHWRGAYSAGERDTWPSAGARWLLIAVIVVGLLVAASQLKVRRTDRLATETARDDMQIFVARRGVQRAVRRAVLGVDGVSTARVKLGRRRVKVRATSRFADSESAGALHDPVVQTVTITLDALRLRRQLAVKAKLSPRKDRRS